MPSAVDARHDFNPPPLLSLDKALQTDSIINSSDDDFESLQQSLASLLVSGLSSPLNQSIQSGFNIADMSPSSYKSDVATLVLKAALKSRKAALCAEASIFQTKAGF